MLRIQTQFAVRVNLNITITRFKIDSHEGTSVPFQLRFVTDDTEEIANAISSTNEQVGFPGGIVGFSLEYSQFDCNSSK